ncbi:bromodomain and PHD finger-containing protein 3 [Coprinopsis cinerea okayama7|uniref:Bromodomain and PHD finger-containing protein 3 n=1 Tax=Coprinopsis cinerea (strain Okayama-7 / 130 / ATCC MYA-4618 / FGSC 9003) TaxID=240176 RepID=A8N8I5_COPC7|nr:bromodomain and PHD finger-containing protein 3 [Coprinopsis cinerea okayama7\|eukprot:XP_001831141.2 bromodomain and PHD finger-containing protein 3 [Coprinopsis cinerea okayama7\
MARGPRHSPGPAVIPKAEFEKIKDDVSTQPNGVHDGQARSFGYNDFSDFTRPDYYIRHIEPLEIDLARQVEYDMDEQDLEWLEAINNERKKEQMDKISYETFEIIMDRLEKEWFDLTKNLPKHDLAMPSEDSTCAICDDSEGENTNAIVFCDGCNLAVHQDCYGVPYIPEGQWLCRKCTVSPENPVQCILCPNEGGAFKQTVTGDWVHLLCAIWVPETRVANEVFMEPITGGEQISKQRWKLKCSLCEQRGGACIQCAKPSCFVAFHTTCARQEKLLLPMKSTPGAEPATLQAYCERHLPREQQEIRTAALAAEAQKNAQLSSTQISKTARAYNKTYKPGPPIVPAIIVNRIVQYINKIKIRRKVEFVQLVCRYWSLKREARRGAPLLKRLHLEPWTASGGKIQSDEQKEMKLDQLKRLRQDLVKLKALTQLTRLREMRKLRQTEIIHQILSTSLFPHEAALRMALEHIMAADRNDYFKNPVNKNEVPDYYDVVLNPMCWTMIEDRLDKHEYWDVQTFKDDIDLVIANALLYNKQGTAHFKVALRLRTMSRPILEKLDQLVIRPPADPAAPAASTSDASSTTAALPVIGDLEPPLEILDLLTSNDAIKDGLNLELNEDPIASLFSFEFARYKPQPPPSPILPPPKPKKKKRDRKAEYERAKARKAARASSGTPAVERAAGSAEPGPSSSVSSGAPPAAPSPESPTRPKKRSSSSSQPLPGAPRVVDDVDNRGSFQLFNAGWILPADHRRGGRAPPSENKTPMPPPRKRQKTEHPSSRLSIVSTAASENQTLETPAPEDKEPKEEDTEKMEVDLSEPKPVFSVSPAPPGTPLVGDVISRTSTDAAGRIVIEELDTPYTRKQKSMRRKAEKERLRREAEAAGASQPPQGGAGPGPVDETTATPSAAPSSTSKSKTKPPSSRNAVAGSSKPPSSGRRQAARNAQGTTDEGSDLSELSDLPSDEGDRDAEGEEEEEEEEEGSADVPEQSSPDSKGKKNRGGPPARRHPRKVTYESGTLVWAKAESYPWWPAVVFDMDHPDVPPNIVADFKATRTKRKIKLWIVRFYDRTNSWQYLPREKLHLLGEDSKLDADMLAPQSVHQKWKSASARQTCRDAYRKACAEMETKSDQSTPGIPGEEEETLAENEDKE